VYWEEKDLKINNDLPSLLNQPYDLVIITTGHRDYRNNPKLTGALLNQKPAFIYDTIGVLTNEEIKELAKVHTVKVIGRGDL
jgi:UDP-N-acetyl-D-mannosaminuronate dehydrogenase